MKQAYAYASRAVGPILYDIGIDGEARAHIGIEWIRPNDVWAARHIVDKVC